ncbi:butyrophilin subfamily 1 member A1-like isoform X2 [Clarias gariepinus]|uniref:butyrophilin subfamily 1 member A1-like isoform X2 n=1 Tax=Clarias gariepinus TaxID=13013 RepID=UPI00234D78AF|nr:butyrophilin subfamily 1 member A1-like isoform X2 [Clarias gariepinus]
MYLCVCLLVLYSFMQSQSAGEDLILPCFIKPNTSAVDMTVEWFKLDAGFSKVHFYDDHEDRNEDQAQTYQGRTLLLKDELKKGNASLKLYAVRVSDEGEYKCLIEDKSWSDDVIVRVIVEVRGSHPVITMESYDNSGGINLVCESRGWNPKPEVLWLDREGAPLSAEETQIHKDTEGFTVKRRITVHDYSDSNKFYCRLQQIHHMMETEVIINGKVFDNWKLAVAISALACLFTTGWIVTAVISRKKALQRRRVEDELAAMGKFAEPQRQKVKEELAELKSYAVDVTLDPDTAHPRLRVSEDEKQVTCEDSPQDRHDTTQRFNKCVIVVGKRSYSRTFYYEVQVSRKTQWILGVMREDINRQGDITVTPQNGFWTVEMRKENEYRANAGRDIRLTLIERPVKVGVYVNYERGLVSFYDVEANSHIYSFSDQSFTKELFPCFSAGLNEGGKDSAPLIITVVND